MVTFEIFATGIETVSLEFHPLCVTMLKIGRCNFALLSFCHELYFFCYLESFPFHCLLIFFFLFVPCSHTLSRTSKQKRICCPGRSTWRGRCFSLLGLWQLLVSYPLHPQNHLSVLLQGAGGVVFLICCHLDLVTCICILLAGGYREVATARPRRVSQVQSARGATFWQDYRRSLSQTLHCCQCHARTPHQSLCLFLGLPHRVSRCQRCHILVRLQHSL